MGANYDMIIVSIAGSNDLLSQIDRYLSAHDLVVDSVCELGSTEIYDEGAVLISPPSHGWVQVVASCSALRVSIADWFLNNPLGRYLSIPRKSCIHVWSLDSGFVAGYSAYEGGMKKECERAFARSAKNTEELMPGVPAPPYQRGEALGAILGEPYDFSSDVLKSGNLELGVAELVSRFGFEAHLVDFHAALDEREGTAIRERQYVAVGLSRWIAVLFH